MSERLHGEIVIPEIDINNRIAEMAEEILDLHSETPLFVALLNGAIPYATHLMYELQKQRPDYNPQLDFMVVKTYGDSQEASEPRILWDLAPQTIVHDRHVKVLDDIADSGATSNAVLDHFEQVRKACKVDMDVLIEREHKPSRATTVGFRIAETRWLVGKGLDSPKTGQGGGRWLPYIAVSLDQPENH